MPLKDVFRQNLIDRLRKANLSQTEFARRLGMKPQMVNKYINGTRDPRLETVARFAQVLGCKPHEMLCEDESLRQRNLFPKEVLFDALRELFSEVEIRAVFGSLTAASPLELLDLVKEIGGWNPVYESLREEIRLRRIGAEHFDKLEQEVEKIGMEMKLRNREKSNRIITEIIFKKGQA